MAGRSCGPLSVLVPLQGGQRVTCLRIGNPIVLGYYEVHYLAFLDVDRERTGLFGLDKGLQRLINPLR